MEIRKLYTVLNSYRDIADNVSNYMYAPIEDADDVDYEDRVDAFLDSMSNLIDALLRTMAFAYIRDNDGDVVKIFDTIDQRDGFVSAYLEIEADRIKAGEMDIRSIDYDEFLDYAQGSEFNPRCYAFEPFDETLCFDPFGNPGFED